MKTSMPQHNGAGGYRPLRSFDGDAANLERCRFPGLGLRILRPPGCVIVWEDSSGQTRTTPTISPQRALMLLAEIEAGDAILLEALEKCGGPHKGETMTKVPVRRNLRIEQDEESRT